MMLTWQYKDNFICKTVDIIADKLGDIIAYPLNKLGFNLDIRAGFTVCGFETETFCISIYRPYEGTGHLHQVGFLPMFIESKGPYNIDLWNRLNPDSKKG